MLTRNLIQMLCVCVCVRVETMAIDSMLPSPGSLSSPMLGFEGLPGRRRKKRTSIETNVRVALERNFITVRQTLIHLGLYAEFSYMHALRS